MNGFHIDMNVAQFEGPYLERWLRALAQRGYDTIIWEVENNIQWRTCPECAAPEAFSQDEFRDLLALCRELNLESVPLLQTIGHGEYVLKHERYQHLAEIEGHIDQYCPRHPELVPFLQRWIDEYLELFGEVKYFHLGADEAWSLGRCDKCAAYARKHSLSDLYIDHINAVCAKFEGTDITPVIWADMVLHHNQALDKLSRRVMLFDWMYDIHRGDGKLQLWGHGPCRAEEMPAAARRLFGPYLYADGDEPGRDAETFYTADYLADKGFQVVTCPASASHGDSVFAPRHWYHVVNTFDSWRKGAAEHLAGSVLTSWTVRLHPWELQTASIDIPGFLRDNPGADVGQFQRHYAQERFGLDDRRIWTACGLLSKGCLFADCITLGFNKHTLTPPRDFVQRKLEELAAGNQLGAELDECRRRLVEYREALDLFKELQGAASKGHDLLEQWVLAAQNLINRARVSAFLLRSALAGRADLALAPGHVDEGRGLLEELRRLKGETDAMYQESLKPTRRAEVVSWIFDSVEQALAASVGEAQ